MAGILGVQPYWYAPWPSYSYDRYYPNTGYSNPPPYDPDASSDYEASKYDASNYEASYSITPRLNSNTLHFNLDGGADPDDSDSEQNAQPPRPEAAPNSSAPAAPAQTRLVSAQPQT
jgi:hypothetical protein